MNHSTSRFIVSTVTLGAIAAVDRCAAQSPALPAARSAATQDERITKLEAQLAAQNAHIDALQHRLSAAALQDGTWEYGAGVNYSLAGNGARLQADVTKISEVPISSAYSSLANVNDDPLIFRVQLQVGF